MITKNVTLTVKDDKATLNDKIVLYQGDKGVEIYFTLVGFNYRFNADNLTFDHVVPRKNGGKTTWENIVTCCRECNSRKGCKTSSEAHMFPLREPHIPSMRELEANSSLRNSNVGNHGINDWLSEAYWNTELEK